MAAIPPAGGAIPITGGAAQPAGANMATLLLQHSSTLVNGPAMATDNMQQRRVKPRSVNSFMAFRSYYSHIFTKMQQKFTSTHVKELWEKDVFKPKWVIIAKAYSIIRGDLGITNAPLDVFLNLICPSIGIIGVDEYLAKMKWEVFTVANGAISLKQTTAPDLSSFEEHLVYTNVTEWDLIAIAIFNNYIPQGAALQNATLIQHGVFPAAHLLHQPAQAAQVAPPAQVAQAAQPVQHAQPAQPAQPAQAAQLAPQTFANRVDFFRSVASDPVATASVVLGFDVKDMLRITGSQPVEWTGSLADIYHPETGYYDMDQAFDEQWNVGNINEPLGFDSIFADSIRDGYIIPAVPDFDGVNPGYI